MSRARSGADRAVEKVVRMFESGELAPGDFKHREHLLVALVYLLRHAPEEAHRRMREGIHAFLRAHGEDPAPVYHETLTVFWLRRVGAFVARAGSGRPLSELAAGLAEECGDSRLAFDYFSRELIGTDEARRGWVEPDLRPLDF